MMEKDEEVQDFGAKTFVWAFGFDWPIGSLLTTPLRLDSSGAWWDLSLPSCRCRWLEHSRSGCDLQLPDPCHTPQPAPIQSLSPSPSQRFLFSNHFLVSTFTSRAVCCRLICSVICEEVFVKLQQALCITFFPHCYTWSMEWFLNYLSWPCIFFLLHLGFAQCGVRECVAEP